jgi:phage gp46-like protein
MPQDRYIQYDGFSRDNAFGDDNNYATITSSTGKVERLLLMHRGKWLADETGELGNEMWNQRLRDTETDRSLIVSYSAEAVQPLVDDGLIDNFKTTVVSTDDTSVKIVWSWQDRATRRQVTTATVYRWGS